MFLAKAVTVCFVAEMQVIQWKKIVNWSIKKVEAEKQNCMKNFIMQKTQWANDIQFSKKYNAN